jgi:hypothetical protein
MNMGALVSSNTLLTFTRPATVTHGRRANPNTEKNVTKTNKFENWDRICDIGLHTRRLEEPATFHMGWTANVTTELLLRPCRIWLWKQLSILKTVLTLQSLVVIILITILQLKTLNFFIHSVFHIIFTKKNIISPHKIPERYELNLCI